MASAMMVMSGAPQGQQGAPYVVLVQQCFQEERPQFQVFPQHPRQVFPQQPQEFQQPEFQILPAADYASPVPQAFQNQRAQPQLVQEESHLLQVPSEQRFRSNSILSISTQCGGSSRGSSRRCTPTAFSIPGSTAPPVAPTRKLVGIPLLGNVRMLCRTKEGCLEVQGALDNAFSDDERSAIAAELREHVVEAAMCINANHVLQKIVSTASPQASRFIVDELRAMGPDVIRVAKHKYGCRVIQRLIEHCGPERLRGLSDVLVAEAAMLSRHLYGTYVIQCILQHGTEHQRRHILAILIDNIELMGADIHGSATIGVALSHVAEADGLQLARAMLRPPGLFASMAISRRGHIAVIRALDALDGQKESALAIEQLVERIDGLRACRYGKLVVVHLMDMVDMMGQASASPRAGAS